MRDIGLAKKRGQRKKLRRNFEKVPLHRLMGFVTIYWPTFPKQGVSRIFVSWERKDKYICASSDKYICASSEKYICASSEKYICASTEKYIFLAHYRRAIWALWEWSHPLKKKYWKRVMGTGKSISCTSNKSYFFYFF